MLMSHCFPVYKFKCNIFYKCVKNDQQFAYGLELGQISVGAFITDHLRDSTSNLEKYKDV
jgi:hypothetical protein